MVGYLQIQHWYYEEKLTAYGKQNIENNIYSMVCHLAYTDIKKTNNKCDNMNLKDSLSAYMQHDNYEVYYVDICFNVSYHKKHEIQSTS